MLLDAGRQGGDVLDGSNPLKVLVHPQLGLRVVQPFAHLIMVVGW